MKHVLSSIKDFTAVNVVEEHKESQGHRTAEGKKKPNVKQSKQPYRWPENCLQRPCWVVFKWLKIQTYTVSSINFNTSIKQHPYKSLVLLRLWYLLQTASITKVYLQAFSSFCVHRLHFNPNTLIYLCVFLKFSWPPQPLWISVKATVLRVFPEQQHWHLGTC